ncbi:MAG: ABC-type transport auxiliary lipoprotein family protein [Rubrivivax sp.]|nr:ABC-type transport auxiliary lipoprotein family protein [Rubrivivax sp.]
MTHPPRGRHVAASRAPRWRAFAGLRQPLAALAVIVVLFAGCSGTLLPSPPTAPARFTLDGAPATPATPATPAPRAAAAAAAGPVLVVEVPRAAPGHDSTRMVYLRRPQELEAFAFHEWVQPPAQMLAPLMVRALQDSRAFRVVLMAPSAASGGLRLETELIRLQQDFSTRPSHVRLTLRAVLLDTATRQALAWREFDESVPAAGDDPVAGVAAAHQATQRVLAALAAFCADQRGP